MTPTATYPIYPDNGLLVSEANWETVRFIESLNRPPAFIAEIGIYKGHTSRELARILGKKGELHLFDFEDIITPVSKDLQDLGFDNVKCHGNSRQTLDSYNWSLARVLEENVQPIYDYVYLDGSHTWNIYALTVLLVDKLLNVGGYLDLDDYEWTISDSHGLGPNHCQFSAMSFTKEQMASRQVKLICDLLLRRDRRYFEVIPNKVFKKTFA